MNIDKVLKTKLETVTGLKVHPIKKPLNAAVPCIVYRRTTTNDVVSQQGDVGTPSDRIQIICTHTTYSGLRSLVATVESALIGNKTDWQVSLPTDIKFDDYDEDDKVFSCSRDYFFRYTK